MFRLFFRTPESKPLGVPVPVVAKGVRAFYPASRASELSDKPKFRSLRRKPSEAKPWQRRAGQASATLRALSRSNPDKMVRCFFAPPSMRNGRSQFSAISMVFPQILCRFSIDFDWFSVIFNQFQAASVNFNQFNQFQSVWLGQKRRNLLTTGRWGKQHLKMGGWTSAKNYRRARDYLNNQRSFILKRHGEASEEFRLCVDLWEKRLGLHPEYSHSAVSPAFWKWSRCQRCEGNRWPQRRILVCHLCPDSEGHCLWGRRRGLLESRLGGILLQGAPELVPQPSTGRHDRKPLRVRTSQSRLD